MMSFPLRSRGLVAPLPRIVFILMVALAVFLSGEVLADDLNNLYRQVNKELRQAQKDMFAGKNDQAVASLEGIRGLLAKAKEADPNSPKLKSYQNKYKKLVKDLERRTGKDLGGGSLTVSKSSSQGPAAPKKPEAKPAPEKKAPAAKPAAKTGTTQAQPAAKTGKAPKKGGKLPHAARRPFKQAEAVPGRIDTYIQRMADPDYRGDKNQLVSNADKTLTQGKEMLDQARTLAAQKGVQSHPDLDRVQSELEASEKRLAEAKSNLGQAQAQASAQASEVAADVKVLKDLYQKVDPVFRKAPGVVIYYNDLKPVNELIQVIEGFEKNDREGVKKSLDGFSAKYGSTEGEIDKKTESMGYSGQDRAGYLYASLNEGLAKVAKTREVMADDLVRKARQMQERSKSGLHDFYRVKNHARIKGYADLAARFQADNPRVKEFAAGLEGWIKQDLDSLRAKIDKATWPKQSGDAPKNASKLTKEAVRFLQQEADKQAAKGKEPRRIVAVVVTGNWRVFKKNILGEVIQWGLPVRVAEQWKSEEAAGLVRAYVMSMLTQEYKGVKKAPPYLGAAVGDSYYINLSAVK